MIYNEIIEKNPFKIKVNVYLILIGDFMTANIPKCLQVLKNRQMQKNEARYKQQNNGAAPSKKTSNQQQSQRSYDNENISNNQQKITNYDDVDKKQRKPLESLNNVNLQYRYNSQQNSIKEKQIPQEQLINIQQKRSFQNQPQYSPPNEEYNDNYYNNFSNDVSNSNIEDSPVQNYQQYQAQSPPQSKENVLKMRNKQISSPQEYYSKSDYSIQSRQNVQSFSNNLNEPQYIDNQDYKMLLEKNKSLEKQIEILQLNQKSFAEMNNHTAQLEDALNRISDLEQMLSAKEKKFQIATDAIAQFQSEINELTAKYKQQGKELLQAQKRIKDLELTNESLMSQVQYNKFYDDDTYNQPIESNRNKYLMNQDDYIDDDRFDSKRKLSRFPDDSLNDPKINSLNKRGRFDDDLYGDYQADKYNDFDQPVSKFSSSNNMDQIRNYDYNQNYQMDSQINRFNQQRFSIQENDYDNRSSFNKPTKINQDPILQGQNQSSSKMQSQNKETLYNKQSVVHPAMKDNLFFGDDQPEKKDNYDLIVQELRDDEIQHDFESFTREKEEKERILSKAPEKGISISKSRRMKEQLDNEIDDLSRKISILKREMKQRGLYC